MSLDSARLIAFSGLAATQVQMSVASSNISNADTKGYTEKTADQQSIISGGMGAGVIVTGISSTVDKLLLKSLVGATSDLGSADTANTYLAQLEQLYGTTNGSTNADNQAVGTSLANSLASFEAALQSLASNPSSPSLQSNVISALNTVATQLNQTSSGIQQLRGNADQDIGSAVQSVNTDLQQIATLNAEIKQQAAAGQPTADLEDQRNTALQDISSKMNVNYFTNSSGDLQIYTTSGQPLVDNSAHLLSYTPVSNVAESTTYPGGFNGIMVNGVDVTSQITSGKIGALVTLRDTTLPNAQAQLDQFAKQLSASLNAVSNQGTVMPPPSSLTGTAAVSGTDSFSGTGTVRIAEVDSSGNLVKYQDIDLSTVSPDVNALVTEINSNTATSGVSASIDANGHLVLTAANSGDGVAVNEMTSSVGGQGFSDYFGLNDLVTGSGALDFAVRSDIRAGTAGLPTATLDSSATLTAGNAVLSPGSATIVNAFYNTLTGPTTFAAVGGLASTTGSFANYAAALVSDVASKSSQASADYTVKQTAQTTYANSLSSQSGVNLDEETNRLSSLQNKYSAASELIQVINTMFSTLLTAMQSI